MLIAEFFLNEKRNKNSQSYTCTFRRLLDLKKVMYKLFGLPMIEHVRRRVLDSGLIESIIVASGDKEILETVKNFGGEVKQTYGKHLNGTSRVAEAVERY